MGGAGNFLLKPHKRLNGKKNCFEDRKHASQYCRRMDRWEGEREGRRKTYSTKMASIEFLAQKRVHSIMAEKE